MILGYVCKYTPVELLTSLGAKTERISPSVSSFNRADAMMHPNMCSYAKSVLEWMPLHEKDCEGIVFTTCCDSIRRLYDTVKTAYPGKFFYLLDIPRKTDDSATALYAERILALAESYRKFRKNAGEDTALSDAADRDKGAACIPAGIPGEKLAEILKEERKEAEAAGSRTDSGAPAGRIRIGLIGARMPGMLSSILEENGAEISFDLSCTGQDRASALWKSGRENDLFAGGAEGGDSVCTGSACGSLRFGSPEFRDEFPSVTPLLFEYARALLMQIPCLRMADTSGRLSRLSVLEENVDGVIDHTVKFCDSYSYEYARIHKQSGVPILKIETDLTKQCEGQIRTRVEAFIEALRAKRKKSGSEENPAAAVSEEAGTAEEMETQRSSEGNPERTKEKMRFGRKEQRESAETKVRAGASGGDVLVCGIDSGSTSTNAVIMNENRQILAEVILRTGAKSGVSADKALAGALAAAGEKLGRILAREDLRAIVSTGYGRVSIPFADRNVTEISCHARGARYFDPNVRTILDIGGQDSKAIRLDADGNVADFVMNDKCAAGTGRFLEAMARTLEVGIDDLGPISMESKENVEISSMCTVFAESEVISLIAQNKEKADIARGVHNAIAGKAVSLMKRVGMEPEYMMTGGVARNPGVVRAIEERIGAKLFICDVPDIVGAVGAALCALDSLI
ncbi:MAG: acyl-CoA dehydratase activase [Lachnospiraceae bacterium]|nr:acyl-CoA dehydratase activase [Lachnospiraceae bacterium]